MLFIDDRVGSREFASAFKPFGIEVTVQRLESADFLFIGKGPDGTERSVAIERKELHDLLASMRDGRLAGYQLINLLGTYDRVILLVEGRYRPNPEDGMLEELVRGSSWHPVRGKFMYREMSAYLTTLKEICDITVERSYDKRETVYLIATWYKWYQKIWEDHSAHRSLYNRPIRDKNKAVPIAEASLIRKIANQVDAISSVKSAHIEQHFNSVYDMVTADEAEWMKIKWKSATGRNCSIGPKTAADIVAALRNKQIVKGAAK